MVKYFDNVFLLLAAGNEGNFKAQSRVCSVDDNFYVQCATVFWDNYH